jgi:hypothetical protein
MPLNDHEKGDLAERLCLIGDMGEPEELIATLRDACQRKAADRRLTAEEAQRWRVTASALTEALATVTASQGPAGPRYVDFEGATTVNVDAMAENSAK